MKRPTFSERLARAVLRRRVPILVFFALLVPPAVWFTATIHIDNASEIWFKKDNPDYRKYQHFLHRFGSDRFFLVSITRDDLFSADGLSTLRGLARSMGALPGVEESTCLLDAPTVTWTGFLPKVGPFLEILPPGEEAYGDIRKRALSTPLFVNHFVSEDGRTAFVIARIGALTLTEKRELVAKARAALAAYKEGDGEIHVAGVPFLEVEFDRLTRRENAIFIPLSLCVITTMIFLLFRSLRVTAWTAPVLLFGVAVTISAFSAAGFRFNLVTSLIPPLLMSIGIANAVHILVHYREEMAKGLEKREALETSLAAMFRPCLFTSLTTAAGFFSLSVADIPPVRQAGAFGGAGILLAFLLSFTLFPAGLSLLDARHFKTRAEADRPGPGKLETFLAWLYAALKKGRWSILLVSGALLALAAVGVSRIRTETNVVSFFKRSNPVRADWKRMERLGAGMTSIEVVLHGGEGFFQDPAHLSRIRRAQEKVEKHEAIIRTLSPVDILDHVSGKSVPDRDAARVAALALLEKRFPAEDNPLRAYLTEDASQARIMARVLAGGSHERLRLAELIRAELTRAFPAFEKVEINGTAPLFAQIDAVILKSQKRMAVVAFLAIFVMTLILLRSLSLSMLAMIPNLLPILLTLGLMGWAGIPLDVGTMIIAGVAVGIAVDDTIHYLTRFDRERKAGGGVEEALERSHRTVGRAMTFTSAILFGGFIVIGLSSFRPVYTFGLLTGLTMALALAGDLLLLPALLLFKRGRGRGTGNRGL